MKCRIMRWYINTTSAPLGLFDYRMRLAAKNLVAIDISSTLYMINVKVRNKTPFMLDQSANNAK